MPSKTFSWKNDTWVKPYLGRYKKTLILALFLGVVTIGFAAALMFTSGWLIGGSAEMPYSILLLGTPLLCVRIFGVGKPLLQYAERLTSHNWVLLMTSSLRVKLYRAFDQQGIFFHSLYRLGDALGLLAEDIGHIQNLYLRTIFPTAIAWIIGLCLVLCFGCYTWWMGLFVAILLVLELLVVPFVSVTVNGMRQAQHKQLKAQLYTETTDDVMGITDWILSGRHRDFSQHHVHTQQRLRALEQSGHAFDRKRDIVIQALFALGALGVFLWAVIQFGGREEGLSNWILAFVLGYFPLLDAFAPLSAAATEAHAHRDSIERLNRLPFLKNNTSPQDSSTKPTETNHAKSASHNSSTDPIETSHMKPTSRTLTLDKVSFTYPGAAHPVLHGLSLSIPEGQKVALLGKSGTGKSTLSSLLRGDLVPSKGTVALGNYPDASIETSTLGDEASRYFGVIQQTTYLFNTTLRENLLIGNPSATDEDLVQVLEKVGLKPLLARLKHGLDTMVDEAGLRFSGGERHRIALARVLLQDTPIVILDEPTVGLDPITENQVLDTVFSTLKDKTVIMVTHHLQGVSLVDRVIFLADGTTLLDGSPTGLAHTSEYFRTLLSLEQIEY